MDWIALDPLMPLPSEEVLATDGEGTYLLGTLERMTLTTIYCRGAFQELPKVTHYAYLEKPIQRPNLRRGAESMAADVVKAVKENKPDIRIAAALDVLHPDLPLVEAPMFDLKYCAECIQMTNHIKGKCCKCMANSIESPSKLKKRYKAPEGELSRWEQLLSILRKIQIGKRIHKSEVGEIAGIKNQTSYFCFLKLQGYVAVEGGGWFVVIREIPEGLKCGTYAKVTKTDENQGI